MTDSSHHDAVSEDEDHVEDCHAVSGDFETILILCTYYYGITLLGSASLILETRKKTWRSMAVLNLQNIGWAFLYQRTSYAATYKLDIIKWAT